MSRNRAIALLVMLGIIASTIGIYTLLPKRYELGESLSQPAVFWHDQEAFIFLDVHTVCRATNVLDDKILTTRYAYMATLLGAGSHLADYQLRAYRLLPSGELISTPLPPHSATYGNWSLRDGNLQFVPNVITTNAPGGFRWDGTKFIAIPAAEIPELRKGASEILNPDDAENDDPGSNLSPSERAVFKAAGWHWKQLNAYEMKGTQATLPIQLGAASFEFRMEDFPQGAAPDPYFSLLAFGIKSIDLVPADRTQPVHALWTQKGWQRVSKDEYEQHARAFGRTKTPIEGLVWLGVLLVLVLLKFGAWGRFILNLFTMKRKVLRSIGTSYAFPPATPAQFPLLDTAGLDRYMREFEGMGFQRLADYSVVSNVANPIPTFGRLFVHKGHHCFAEAGQVFPHGKRPSELKCTIVCSLADRWSLGFSDRKPRGAHSLIRRRKAMVVNMPDATPYELLTSFLEMRGQVCQDLGISPLKNDTLEAYVTSRQRALAEIRDAVKEKNMASAVSQVYLRRLELLKTKPEYVWLGDYPKELEQRKQGFVVQARAL